MKELIFGIDKNNPIDLLLIEEGNSKNMEIEKKSYEEKAYHYLENNLLGIMKVIFPTIEKMKERNNGQICIISTLMASNSYIKGFYSATKKLEEMFGLQLRQKLKNNHIYLSIAELNWNEMDSSKILNMNKKGKKKIMKKNQN
jgi:NADP-dependent 3-hydroxy acid dehydrogenase YdfG